MNIDSKWLLKNGFKQLKAGFSVTDEQYDLYKKNDYYIYINLNFPMLRCHNYNNEKNLVLTKDTFKKPFTIEELKNILTFLNLDKKIAIH